MFQVGIGNDNVASDDKVVGWVKKGQNHDDVILESTVCKAGC